MSTSRVGRLLFAALLFAACGTVSADPHDAAPAATGGAAAAGGAGGQAGAPAAAGAAGSSPGGAPGTGGAPLRVCPKTSSCSYVVSATCCEGCQIESDAGTPGGFVTDTCTTPAWWSNSAATGYCVAKAADCP